MKRVKLLYAPNSQPTLTLEVGDLVAAALVRAGAAAAADPTEAGSLGGGEPLSPSTPTLVTLSTGARPEMRRVFVPQAVAALAVAAGVAALVGNGDAIDGSETATITGTPPAATAGQPYSFQFTILPPGTQVTSVVVTRGGAPDTLAAHGATLSASGLLSSAGVIL